MEMRVMALVTLLVSGPLLAHTASAAEDPFAALRVERLADPKPMPELALPGLDGRIVKLPQELRGKVVLLSFFTTT
jgi:hypothetical protein